MPLPSDARFAPALRQPALRAGGYQRRAVYRPNTERPRTLRVMSQDSADKDGAKTVAVVRAEGGRFAVGSAGGPGRPKRGQTLAEQWRRETDWPKLRARLESIVHDTKAKHADVVSAARELLDRSWGKAVASHELVVSQGEAGPRIRSDATDDELLALIATADRVLDRDEDAGPAPAALPSVPQTSATNCDEGER